MNKVIMITGANAGIGKDTARQLAQLNSTEKIYLACRNPQKAKAAKKELELATGKNIFEIIIMDVSSPESVRNALTELNEPVDALILNAGGMGGKDSRALTKDGVMSISAVNLLGHVVLVEEMLKENKINKVVLYASSEAARGIKKMGMKRPALKSSSVDEFATVLDGTYFGNKFDAMEAYGAVKYTGTLWMSHMARKHPNIKFISMSPGGTRGTEGMDDMPLIQRIMMKYVGMRLIMPLIGLSHSLASGAKRFVDGISNAAYQSGVFYASRENVLTGSVIDQSQIFPDLRNTRFQENASLAIHRFIR